MLKHFLSADVYLGLTDAYAVFLDLKRNRYLALDRSKSSVIGALMQAQSAQDGAAANSDAVAGSNIVAVVNALVEKGLLTQDRSAGKEIAAVASEPTRTVLLEEDSVTRAKLRIPCHCATRFLVAYASASLALSFRSIWYVVRRVRIRKEEATRGRQSFDVDLARELLAIYRYLRLFMLPTHQPALLDSLVLVEFLSWYGLFPSLVFGVRAVPFGAHTWVQQDDKVFNGTLESIRKFTPIMVV